MPIGKVWIYRLLFLFVCYLLVFVSFIVCVCTVTEFSGKDKASGVEFGKAVQGLPGQGIPHFGELSSRRSPKSDESASHRKVESFIREGTPETSR